MLPHLPIFPVLLVFMGNMGSVDIGIPKMSVNGTSTIVGVASYIIKVLCGCI
jgi:hypothetical protein